MGKMETVLNQYPSNDFIPIKCYATMTYRGHGGFLVGAEQKCEICLQASIQFNIHKEYSYQ